MWTVYKNPLDYPDKYVARRFEIHRGYVEATAEVIIEDTYLAIRQAMNDKLLVKLARSPGDEPQIMETWI